MVCSTISPQKGNKNKARQNYFQIAILYCILGVLTVLFLLPFLWLISNSLKQPSDIFKVPIVWFPKPPQFRNYAEVITTMPFFRYLRNTIIIVSGVICGSVLSNTIIAYSFARIRWKGRNTLFVLVLITMMIPYQIIMIPQFLFFHQIKWVGTFLPLIVPSFLGNAFFIFLLRQFYVLIPEDVSEAAYIDGAKEFTIFRCIILPLVKPAVVTVVIFAFLNTWNDFLGPLVFLTNEKRYTLAIGIQQIMSLFDPRWQILMAAGVLVTLPVLLLFFLMQKYFIQGVAFTGVKG